VEEAGVYRREVSSVPVGDKVRWYCGVWRRLRKSFIAAEVLHLNQCTFGELSRRGSSASAGVMIDRRSTDQIETFIHVQAERWQQQAAPD